MKKYLSYMLAAALGLGSLGLVACGGGGAGTDSGTSTGEATEATEATTDEAAKEEAATDETAKDEAATDDAAKDEAAKDEAAKEEAAPAGNTVEDMFGDWKIACFEYEGLTMAGDISDVASIPVTNLNIAEDGTGSMTITDDDGDDVTTFAWERVDDKTISVVINDTEDVEAPPKADMTIEDGVLRLGLEADGQTGALIFTKDGKLGNIKVISRDDASTITSADYLVGSWKLAGVRMEGMIIYGDPDKLTEMMGDAVDVSVTFGEDGTATIFGSEAAYSVGESGASIDDSGVSVPVLAYNDGIMIDLGSVMDMDMLIVYQKA